MFTRAICRRPGPDFAQGITTADLGRPHAEGLLVMHDNYVRTLQSLGLQVDVLPSLPGYPDAYFVEDAAVVLPEVAVITRPGAKARQGEEQPMAQVLSQYRPLAHIQSPGTLEGGDVLVVGKQVFVGLSERTNEAGLQQLSDHLRPFGYTCHGIPVAAGLHFKSSVNWVGGNALLLTEAFAGFAPLRPFRQLIVPAEEAYATNTLWLNGTLMTPTGFPVTRRHLDTLGLPIVELDCTEPMKMDGGLTCLSLRF